MAKSISCADVGMTDCTWSASAETEEDLLAKCQAHGKEHHGFDQIPPEVLEKVKGAIKDV